MKLDELQPVEGSKSTRNRVGRGIGSGNGKTSGRGHKGQKARSGGSIRPGFEGGQMPLYRRIPKRGFTNIFREEYLEVKISDLEKFENDVEVTLETLKLAGIVKGKANKLVVLGNGELTKKLTVKANKFTKTAESKITAVGGKAEVV